MQFSVFVTEPCVSETLIIDSSDSVFGTFGTPVLTQDVWQPVTSLTWDQTIVTMASLLDPTAECGSITFEVLNQDGFELDTPFTAILDGSLGVSQELETYTADPDKVGIYDLRVKTYFADYAAFISEKDFTIEIVDGCNQINSVTAS